MTPCKKWNVLFQQSRQFLYKYVRCTSMYSYILYSNSKWLKSALVLWIRYVPTYTFRENFNGAKVSHSDDDEEESEAGIGGDNAVKWNYFSTFRYSLFTTYTLFLINVSNNIRTLIYSGCLLAKREIYLAAKLGSRGFHYGNIVLRYFYTSSTLSTVRNCRIGKISESHW